MGQFGDPYGQGQFGDPYGQGQYGQGQYGQMGSFNVSAEISKYGSLFEESLKPLIQKKMQVSLEPILEQEINVLIQQIVLSMAPIIEKGMIDELKTHGNMLNNSLNTDNIAIGTQKFVKNPKFADLPESITNMFPFLAISKMVPTIQEFVKSKIKKGPDAKPTDAKPTDAKPTDAKPTDAKPGIKDRVSKSFSDAKSKMSSLFKKSGTDESTSESAEVKGGGSSFYFTSEECDFFV